MIYTLPKLDYSFDALEPTIDAMTMEIHYSKHHQAYIDNLNKALADFPAEAEKPIEKLLSNLEAVPEKIRTAVRNHGGGHYNHSLFWKVMTGDTKLRIYEDKNLRIIEEINKVFGDMEKFKEQFGAAAMGRFGSGWAWLVVDGSGQLSVASTANQDTPLSEGKKPLLGLDVWEHAYYLKYQNRRKDYVDAWWKVVNWVEVEKNFGIAG
ncbi:superoxide dismutase [Candidatus Collierbacteria bacterium]|nr:superoxide dismutase [Candidatus Collierbacteria bacterium]